jgi:competence protein ComEC
VGGLVLGADEDLTRVTTEAFRAAGTAHLLAVSGQNVALLAAALSLVVWLAGGGRATAQVVCIAAVIAYVGVVGPSPSVVRAGVAGVLTATAWLLSRPVDRWHLFGAGAAVLLLANPWSLLDAGFQLSFTAVAAILLLVPPLERRLQGTSVPGLVRAPLAVSVACTLATAPIGYLHFDRMGIVAAVPANLAAAPAVAPTLWLGLTAAAVDPLAPRLGRGLARGARWPARYLLWVSRVGARLDAWSARRRVPMAIAVGGTAAVAVLAQGLAARRRRPGSPRLS